MADISVDYTTWSTTESSNPPAGTTVVGTGLDDNLRAIQTGVANLYADLTAGGIPDLFLDSGGVINFNSGDVTVTHAANQLTIAGGTLVLDTQHMVFTNGWGLLWGDQSVQLLGNGAAETLQVYCAGASQVVFGDGSIYPATSDDVILGTSTNSWSDIFIASGGVINWNNGAATITESSGSWIFGGTNGTQFAVADTAGAINYLEISGASGESPSLSALGGSTDVNVFLNPKNSGHVQFGTHAALSGESVTGYITIKDAAGNERKLAVVS